MRKYNSLKCKSDEQCFSPSTSLRRPDLQSVSVNKPSMTLNVNQICQPKQTLANTNSHRSKVHYYGTHKTIEYAEHGEPRLPHAIHALRITEVLPPLQSGTHGARTPSARMCCSNVSAGSGSTRRPGGRCGQPPGGVGSPTPSTGPRHGAKRPSGELRNARRVSSSCSSSGVRFAPIQLGSCAA